MNKHFDIIIIGGGNAGFAVSAVAHEAGRKIAFVEERDFGGTCPNRGCTPKKVFVAAAHALHEIAGAADHGIAVGKPVLDWRKMLQQLLWPLAEESAVIKQSQVARGTSS